MDLQYKRNQDSPVVLIEMSTFEETHGNAAKEHAQYMKSKVSTSKFSQKRNHSLVMTDFSYSVKQRQPSLKLQNFKSFKKKQILQDITFALEAGEVVALLGSSG